MKSHVLNVALAAALLPIPAEPAEDPALAKKLVGLDAYMQKLVKDWNVPGIGLGIVVKDRLAFACGVPAERTRVFHGAPAYRAADGFSALKSTL